METLTMFPEKIRALIVDNDARFLRSCSTVLSQLNFKVTTCKKSGPAALRVLLGSKPKDLDVLLVEAEKAATSGFDFRGIVEPNLSIPVIYYYHEATGDRVDAIRRILRSGTYTIRRPLDIEDVRHLWRVIAWRKCRLNGKPPNQAGSDCISFPSTAVLGGSDGRGLKRKNSGDPGSSSSSGVTGDYSAMEQQQMNMIQGQGRVNLLASQQQQGRHGMEAMRNNGKAPMSPQVQAMEARQKLRRSVMQSVLRALNMPQYNPSSSIFADGAGPSITVAATCAGASNTAGPSSLPVYPPPPAPVPAPPLPPVNPRLFPAQAPPPLYPTPPPARIPPVYPAPAAAPAPGPHYLFAPQSRGTGPVMLNFQQPQAGDPFTGMSSAAATNFGASAIAQTGAYTGNAASSSRLHGQSLNPGADDQNELSAMVAKLAIYTGPNPNPNPPMAPQHVADGPNEAAIAATLYNNNYTNYNAGGSLAAAPPQHVHAGHDAAAFAAAVMEIEAALNSDDDDFSSFGTGSSHMTMAAPDQVLGMATNVNELTAMAGLGAFGGGDVGASSAAPNNGAHVAPGAVLDDDDTFSSLTGPLVGPGAAMDGDASFGTMSPDADDNSTFPLEYLMGLLDDGGQNDGATSATGGATSTATDVAGTSQTGGDVGDFWPNGTGNFMFPRDDVNQGRE